MTATMLNRREALIIAQQLGREAISMMGAKNLVADFRELRFQIGRNAKRVTNIRITLNMMDTYNLTFFSVQGFKVKEVAHVEDVYADQLHQVIEENTGLYLSI